MYKLVFTVCQLRGEDLLLWLTHMQCVEQKLHLHLGNCAFQQNSATAHTSEYPLHTFKNYVVNGLQVLVKGRLDLPASLSAISSFEVLKK
jgi:hypothetical protein